MNVKSRADANHFSYFTWMFRLLFILLFALAFSEGRSQSDHYVNRDSLFSIPDMLDLRTMTDSTRFRPQFVNPERISGYELVIRDEDARTVFRTEVYQQGWNGLLDNRHGYCDAGNYYWDMKVKEDSVEYSFTGIVTLLNPETYFRITALDTISCPLTYYLPNSLCPNCEMVDDELRPYFGCPPMDYIMIIYDRWGNVFFESHDPNKGWDGRATDGQPAQFGVYVCTLKWRYYEGDALHRVIYQVTLVR